MVNFEEKTGNKKTGIGCLFPNLASTWMFFLFFFPEDVLFLKEWFNRYICVSYLE